MRREGVAQQVAQDTRQGERDGNSSVLVDGDRGMGHILRPDIRFICWAVVVLSQTM